MSSDRIRKDIPRTMDGLREALFQELEDLKNGTSAPHETFAFCKLAKSIVETVDVQLKNRALDLAERQIVLRENAAPKQIDYRG